MNDTIMAEEMKQPNKKAFISKPYSRDEKIKQDEEELEQLLQEQKGESPESSDEAEPTNAEEKTFKKRYGDLRRHMQEKENEFQT